MHYKTLLATALFYSIPLIHAYTIADVNGANKALANEASNYDINVNELNLANDATKANVRFTSTTQSGVFSLTEI